ncbi:MAG: M14 family zinc carboxypeptidase [Gemmatimonadales bacterium]
MSCRSLWVAVLSATVFGTWSVSPVRAQAYDSTYAAEISAHTTDERFVNELVDHLPWSASVPSPLDHFGTIIGAPDILHTTTEIYSYLAAMAEASPRVSVRTMGKTEENRDMIEVVIADEATIADMERYRGYLNTLADPRGLADDTARTIIASAKPVYYITAGLHSPETGSPEMVMELAYRLAVEDSPFIEAIRNNVIVVILPVAEPDGRDRMVDTYRYKKANRDVGPPLRYWGRYVAHDNNRDGNGLGLALTRNVLASYLHWKPTVMHDLHESGYFLYISTGTGPYNQEIDALTIDEWHNLAHEEVTQLTKYGMPGVWTHAFYTGWAANYLVWIANTRNSIGRFYETLGNAGADTRERELPARATSREWYRPNPPLEKVTWSLRNNTNYMQSGVLVALKYTADNREKFLEHFYLRGVRAVERGMTEAPFAWVIPREQRRPAAAVNLANLLLQQGVEVGVAGRELEWSSGGDDEELNSAAEGSFVIRMDQPYRTVVQVLLGEQEFPSGETPPYDDVGWTLPYLHGVEAIPVADSTILEARTNPLTEPAVITGRLEHRNRDYYLVNNTTDDNIAMFRFRLEDVQMQAAEQDFEMDDREYKAGSLVVPSEGNPADLEQRLESAAEELGIEVRGVRDRPSVPTHDLEVPRVALVHTWVSTPQDAGWWRLTFDRFEIPYTYLSEQDLGVNDLTDFDVVIMPNHRSSPQDLVSGTTVVGEPIPWRTTDEYSAIGTIDETDDLRRGMGYDGLKNLKAFVEGGGVFRTEGGAAAFPIQMAITRRVSIRTPRQLVARGSVLRTTIEDDSSPIVYGYPDSVGAYFSSQPVFEINKNDGGTSSPEWLRDEVWEREIPRVVMSFAKEDVLMSGMLSGESEIAGTPAIVDVPVGEGHVVLFAIRPLWRLETFGSHAFVFNTMLHWNDLRVGWPTRPDEGEEVTTDGGR